jgi:hypothetical protein
MRKVWQPTAFGLMCIFFIVPGFGDLKAVLILGEGGFELLL